MNKRKNGERAKILFDSIDLEVLKKLNTSSDGIGVLDLAKQLKLSHISLKPHIDKLIHLELIKSWKDQNKNVLVSFVGIFKEMLKDSGDKEFLEEFKNQESLVLFLERAMKFSLRKENQEDTNIDLRNLKQIDKFKFKP